MVVYSLDHGFMKKYIRKKELQSNVKFDFDKYVSTGFRDIDNRYGGLKRGDTYLIVGAYGIGKTSFAYNIWNRQIEDKQYFPKTMVFSTLLSKEQTVERLACINGKLDYTELDINAVDDKYRKVLYRIAESSSTICEKVLSIDDISDVCESFEWAPDLVIIDDLDLIDYNCCAAQGNGDDRNKALLIKAKELAQREKCVVLMLSEATGIYTQDTSNYPTLENTLFDVDYVDYVWTIHREDYYDKETDKCGIAEINVLMPEKEREHFELAWIPEVFCFANLECRH